MDKLNIEESRNRLKMFKFVHKCATAHNVAVKTIGFPTDTTGVFDATGSVKDLENFRDELNKKYAIVRKHNSPCYWTLTLMPREDVSVVNNGQ